MNKVYYKTISELAPLLERKEISPVELTQSILLRIEELDSKLNSYLTLLADDAVKQAMKAEKEIQSGLYRGPLHGIPIGLKDLYYTKGIVTTAGSEKLRNFVPSYHATVVEKLLDAGMVLTGKLNTHEFAFGATNENPHFGDAHNPWDFERITGGSSGGGGASVAAGLSVATLGSDTGGSIRTPSALCGIYGLKPTFGRVSKYGVVPLAFSLDHVGPMARGVEDLAIILDVIAGYDHNDPTTVKKPADAYRSYVEKEIKGMKIGVPQNYFFDDIQAEIKESVLNSIKAFESLGAELVEITIPELDLSMFAEMVTICAEAAAYHHDTITNSPEVYGHDVRYLLEQGQKFTAVEYIKAQQDRKVMQQGFDRVFSSVDVLIAPTLPLTAPKIGKRKVEINGVERDYGIEFVRLAAPANLTGIPSLSVPIGLSSENLPIAMQILGKPFKEGTVIQVASAFEKHLSSFKGEPIL